MVPFEKMLKNTQQKWYHLRKYASLAPLNPLKFNPLLSQKIKKKGVKNGAISEHGQNYQTKMVPFQK